MDRLFRHSRLFRKDKWDRSVGGGQTYGQATIDKAIAACPEVYGKHAPSEKLPEIMITDRPLQDLTAKTLAALEAANTPPSLFVRSGALCRVRSDENKRPIIDQMNESQVRHRIARSAYFIKKTKQYISPPTDVVKDVMAHGTWAFPTLNGIVETPVLREDGSIASAPGYDAATKLVIVPAPGLKLPAIPESPTAKEVEKAKELLEQLIGQFPFATPASKTNAIAALLTPILRPIISGAVPLALFDAPMPGTGKGLLAECLSLIPTGRNAVMMTAPDTEEEWRKRITAILLEGAAVITIDNL
jgi:hypothetical protein